MKHVTVRNDAAVVVANVRVLAGDVISVAVDASVAWEVGSRLAAP